jgi:hypothetical protein
LELQTRVAEIDASIGDFVAVKMVRIAAGLSNCHSGASITQNVAIGGHYHRFMKPSLPSTIGITGEHKAVRASISSSPFFGDVSSLECWKLADFTCQ